MTIWPGWVGRQAGAAAGWITLAGRDVAADPAGALFVEGEGALLVADLHLEKGSSFAARGQMLPPYDSLATLAALAAVVERYRPRIVAVLGDTLHDRGALGRMDGRDRSAIHALQRGRDWIWLTGNHDPEPQAALGGRSLGEMVLAGIALRHAPSPVETRPEIAGHLHPAGKVRGRGRAVRRRCFVSDGRRCVMPAFGSFAGGLNVLDRAFDALFPGGTFTAHMLGRDRVFAVGRAQLSPD